MRYPLQTHYRHLIRSNETLLSRDREGTVYIRSYISTCTLFRRRSDSPLRSYLGFGRLKPPNRGGTPKWSSVGRCPGIGTIPKRRGEIPAEIPPLRSTSCTLPVVSESSRPEASYGHVGSKFLGAGGWENFFSVRVSP